MASEMSTQSTSIPRVLVCRPKPRFRNQIDDQPALDFFSRRSFSTVAAVVAGVREPYVVDVCQSFYRAWLLGMLQDWIDRERAVDHPATYSSKIAYSNLP